MTVIIEKDAGFDAANAVDISDLGAAMYLAVKGEATRHVLTGTYLAGIQQTTDEVNGVTHHITMVEDDNVYAIEWGHFVWGKFSSDVRVPGQFVLTNAYRTIAGA